MDQIRQSEWVANVNSTDLKNLWTRQNGICALTGLPMLLDTEPRDIERPSVDRIDSDRGYHKDNIRLVQAWVNIARQKAPDSKILDVIRRAGENLRNKEEII